MNGDKSGLFNKAMYIVDNEAENIVWKLDIFRLMICTGTQSQKQ